MPSTQQHMESTSVPDQMAGSSTSPVSEPRQRYTRLSSRTCCLLMTQQLQRTPMMNSSHWWTAYHRSVSVLRTDHQSEGDEHPGTGHYRSLSSTTTNSILSDSSPTQVPSSLTTYPRTQRSTRGFGRQLQLSLVSRLEYEKDPSCL